MYYIRYPAFIIFTNGSLNLTLSTGSLPFPYIPGTLKIINFILFFFEKFIN